MRGVIFDFNGTMFYDEKFQNAAWREFLAEKTGRSVTDQEFQTYIHGRNAEVTFSYFLSKELTREEVADLEEGKEKIYRTLCLNSGEFHLADGLPEFLDALTERRIPITIATASGLNNVKFFFQHFHLDRWFDLSRVMFNDGTIKGKPDPDIYRRAAEKIGIRIEDCVVFEDAASGIEAAKRASAHKVIGVTSMQSREKLLDLGVSGTIQDYSNLEQLLDMITDAEKRDGTNGAARDHHSRAAAG